MSVLFSDARYGLWPSLYASMLSALIYNFFFIPPLYTFTIASPQELLAFIDELPNDLDEVHEARHRVATTARLPEDDRESSDSAHVADEFADWLIGYFQYVSIQAVMLFFPQAC